MHEDENEADALVMAAPPSTLPDYIGHRAQIAEEALRRAAHIYLARPGSSHVRFSPC